MAEKISPPPSLLPDCTVGWFFVVTTSQTKPCALLWEKFGSTTSSMAETMYGLVSYETIKDYFGNTWIMVTDYAKDAKDGEKLIHAVAAKLPSTPAALFVALVTREAQALYGAFNALPDMLLHEKMPLPRAYELPEGSTEHIPVFKSARPDIVPPPPHAQIGITAVITINSHALLVQEKFGNNTVLKCLTGSVPLGVSADAHAIVEMCEEVGAAVADLFRADAAPPLSLTHTVFQAEFIAGRSDYNFVYACDVVTPELPPLVTQEDEITKAVLIPVADIAAHEGVSAFSKALILQTFPNGRSVQVRGRASVLVEKH